MADYIAALIKIVRCRGYAEDFIQGKLYMNNIDFFNKSQLEEVGDNSEVTAIVMNYNLKIGNRTYILPGRIIDSGALCHPAFCMQRVYQSDYLKNKKNKN